MLQGCCTNWKESQCANVHYCHKVSGHKAELIVCPSLTAPKTLPKRHAPAAATPNRTTLYRQPVHQSSHAVNKVLGIPRALTRKFLSILTRKTSHEGSKGA